MQDEASHIWKQAEKERHASVAGLATEIYRLFAKCGLKCDIPELRGSEINPISFEE